MLAESEDHLVWVVELALDVALRIEMAPFPGWASAESIQIKSGRCLSRSATSWGVKSMGTARIPLFFSVEAGFGALLESCGIDTWVQKPYHSALFDQRHGQIHFQRSHPRPRARPRLGRWCALLAGRDSVGGYWPHRLVGDSAEDLWTQRGGHSDCDGAACPSPAR